jgi:glycosyltransferase involved in cell wall biosynthesis
LKIAIDATVIGSGRGGDETYLFGLLRALAATAEPRDAFVLYLSKSAGLPAGLSTTSFQVRHLGSSSRVARYVWELPRKLARELPKPDLILSTNHAPIWSSVPRALIVHDLSFRHHPEYYPSSTRWRLAVLVPLHLRQASVVLTGTEFSRADLIRTYGLPDDRVHVVPPVIEPGVAVPNAGRVRAALGVGDRYFLYVGNLHPRKNLDRLIDAFRLARRTSDPVQRSQLVIAGAPWWADDTLKTGVADLPADSVVRLGRVTDEERDALLRGALALAYPSLFEGIGLPPLEAMAVGTPVLASRVSAMPEVLGDAALLVDPLSSEEIAIALRRLAEDDGLRAQLVVRGLQRAHQFTATAAGKAARRAFSYALAKDREGAVGIGLGNR